MGRRVLQGVLAVLTGCGLAIGAPPAVAPAQPAPPAVIFDADMDWDDAAALAYLVAEDELGRIDLRAVTVTDNGAGYPGSAIRHARCLLQQLGMPDLPVADGSDTAPHAYPTEMRDSVDRVLDSVTAGCTASAAPSAVRAPDLIRQVLQSTPATQVIVSGSLSNVAAASPLTSSQVTVMGGAVRVPGNLCCGTPPQFDGTQEFNFWVDPPADRTFLAANAGRVQLIPVDATRDVPITAAFADRIDADRSTAEARVVSAIARHPEVDLSGELSWWDPLAAVAALHPGIVPVETGRLDVIADGPSAGRTVLSPLGTDVRFGTSANREAFEQCFIDVLNHQPGC